MKYFTMSLALLGVLAMASVSLAAYSVEVIPVGPVGVDLDDPNDVLQSFVVRFTGVNAWQDLKIIDGEVHQMNRYSGTPKTIKQSAWASIINDYEDYGALVYDTHINDIGLSLSFGTGDKAVGVEVNNMDNPGGLSFDDYSLISQAGMGTFDTTGTAYTIQGTPEAYYDLVQVVLLKGQQVRLTGLFADSATSAKHPIVDPNDGLNGIVIGAIPEPGMIVMLIAGALCLLGIRRK